MKRKLLLTMVVFPLVVLAGEEANAQVGGTGIICDNSVVPTVSAAATVVVTGVAGKHVNICGWETSAGSTVSGTITLGWSTVANVCTTSVTTLTHAMDVNTVAWSRKDSPFAVISTPAGMSLCATPTATAIKYTIFFNQG